MNVNNINSRFLAPNGDGVLTPELIDGEWRVIWIKADGTRKTGKTVYASQNAALMDLRKNSSRA
jgi:hypothetical protein